MKNIIEMLENSARKYPDKQVFADADRGISYSEFLDRVYSIGTAIVNSGFNKEPIAIIAERSVCCLEIMFGVLAGGCFYTVIDSEMPTDRIRAIFNTLKPSAVIATDGYAEKAADVGGVRVIEYGAATSCRADKERLSVVRKNIIDTDPAYVL